MATSKELIGLARQLRIEDRLSSRLISERTGIPEGTLAPFLKDIPLSMEERAAFAKASRSKTPRRGTAHENSKRNPDFNAETYSRLNTVQKGMVSEIAVKMKLISLGFVPLTPDLPSQRFDLVCHDVKSCRYSRIQIKSASWGATGMPSYGLHTNSNGQKCQYSCDDFDAVVAYSHETGRFFIRNASDLAHVMGAKKVASTIVTARACDEDAWENLFPLESSELR